MISEFQGEYRFLSNFWPVVVEFEGHNYASVEHAYVAAKTLNQGKRALVREIKSPGEVKRLGRKLVVRADWEEVRLDIMRQLVTDKFTNNHSLRLALIRTGNQELIEGNAWRDTFWGVCKGRGCNHLGKIIMQVRSDLQKEYGNATG